MAYVQTIYPGYIPDDYFTKENVEWIQKRVTELIHKDISTNVTIDIGSIVRVMQRILEQRLESIPSMNQRVLMELTRHYLNYQVEANRNLYWAEMFVESQRLFDQNARRGAIANWTVKLNPKHSATTQRFYFT
jgi:restriction endonuclease